MLIGLHGKKQAGKDTVFARACHLMRDVLPVERVSFADLLYQSAAASLGVTVEQLQEWKSNPDYRVQVAFDDHQRRWVYANTSVREYLQAYGTEAHRNVFGTDFWVNAVNLTNHEGRIVMVTDVRFENEALAVREAGGHVFRVVGPVGDEDGHASEVPLPDHLVDGEICNTVRDDDFRVLDARVGTMIRLLLREAGQHVLSKDCWCEPDCEDCP